MDCFTLNERLYNALSDFMEQKNNATQFNNENIGSLLQEFLHTETRDNYLEVAKDFSALKLFLSEYKDKFTTICNPHYLKERKEMFDQLFKNYGYGNEFFMDFQGTIYDGNYVTTQDLTMNHWTKNLCGPVPRKFGKGKYLPETDCLSAVYPNLTKWGLIEKLHQTTKEPICQPQTQVSEYKAQFGCNFFNKKIRK